MRFNHSKQQHHDKKSARVTQADYVPIGSLTLRITRTIFPSRTHGVSRFGVDVISGHQLNEHIAQISNGFLFARVPWFDFNPHFLENIAHCYQTGITMSRIFVSRSVVNHDLVWWTGAMRHTHASPVNSVISPVLIIFALAYLTSHVFIGIFDASANTILHCYLMDLDIA